MIVTVTLNAALDVAYEAEGLAWQSTRDVSRTRFRAGGRGVAVARVLHTFGHEVVAAGLAGLPRSVKCAPAAISCGVNDRSAPRSIPAAAGSAPNIRNSPTHTGAPVPL